MGTGSISLPSDLPKVGDPTHQYVCNRQQQKMHQVLLQGRSRPRLPRGRINGPVKRDISLHVSSTLSCSKNYIPHSPDLSKCHSHSTLLATPGVVFYTKNHGDRSLRAPMHPAPSHTKQQQPSPSGCPVSPSGSVEDSPMIKNVPEKARKPSTYILYTCKWKRSCKYASSKGFQPTPVSLSDLTTSNTCSTSVYLSPLLKSTYRPLWHTNHTIPMQRSPYHIPR